MTITDGYYRGLKVSNRKRILVRVTGNMFTEFKAEMWEAGVPVPIPQTFDKCTDITKWVANRYGLDWTSPQLVLCDGEMDFTV